MEESFDARPTSLVPRPGSFPAYGPRHGDAGGFVSRLRCLGHGATVVFDAANRPGELGRIARQIADAGVRVSIDDFGTGHSSLAYLKDLTVHEVKIDRSFITGLGQDAESDALVQAIIGMAGALPLNTVA